MNKEIIKTKEWEELQTIYSFLLNNPVGIEARGKMKVSHDNLQKLSEIIEKEKYGKAKI